MQVTIDGVPYACRCKPYFMIKGCGFTSRSVLAAFNRGTYGKSHRDGSKI